VYLDRGYCGVFYSRGKWVAYGLFSLLMLLQLFAIIYSKVRLSHDLKEYWQIRHRPPPNPVLLMKSEI